MRKLTRQIVCLGFTVLLCSALTVGCGPKAGDNTGDQQYPVATPAQKPAPYDGVKPFSGHRAPIADLAFGRLGDVIFSAAPGEDVIAWNANSGAPLRKYIADVEEEVVGLAVDPDGSYVALAGPSGIHVWDVKSGTLERTLRLPQTDKPGENDALVTSVAVASKSEFLLVGDSVGRLVIMSAEDGEVLNIFRTGLEPVSAIGNGNTWAAVTDGRKTLVIDLREEPVPLPLRGKMDGLGIMDVDRFDKGLTGTDGSNIINWGPDFQASPRAIKVDGIVDYSADGPGGRGAAVLPNGDLAIWDLNKVTKLDVEFQDPGTARLVALESSREGDGLLVATVEGGQIVVRNTRTGKVQARMFNAIVPTFLMFEPGNHRFLVGGSDGRPTRFDLDSPGELDPFKQMSSPIVEGILDLDANGYYVTTADGTIVVFDYTKGRVAREVAVAVGQRPHIALNKSRLAVVSERRGLTGDQDNNTGELVIFDLLKGKNLATLKVTDAVDVAFAPAGPKVFYAGRSGFIETWNYENNQRKKHFDEINSVARRLRLAPGGTLLALCGDEGVTFYSPSLKVLSAAQIPNVLDITFAYDGTRAVASTADNGVYLILFEGDGIKVEPLVQMPTAITSTAISSDNRFLLVGESRGTVSAFDLNGSTTTPSATLQVINEGRWVIYTPEGLWAGDPPKDMYFEDNGTIFSKPQSGRQWLKDRPSVVKALQ